MPKSIIKKKGNRYEKVTYHIGFYTDEFFDPRKTTSEDGDLKSTSRLVKLPIKVFADGDESRSNVTSFQMKGISHFDNNVEGVLEALSQLMERVVKPKNLENSNEEWKVTM